MKPARCETRGVPSVPAVKVLPIAVCTVAGKKFVEKIIALRVILNVYLGRFKDILPPIDSADAS